MKAFIISCILLLSIAAFVGIHSFIMMNLSNAISAECQKVTELAINDQWSQVTKSLDRIRSIWDKKCLWASLTISTKDIEEIEIALTQSRAYAELKQKPDFFGEFIMFQKLVEHIPHQEGFHIEELL